MKKLVFTVTNDLSYDQRMIRICSSLTLGGYDVLLIGRKFNDSVPIISRPFEQKRIRCFFNKGFAGYAEYNFRLFFLLLWIRHDLICAIDLDTIIPCWLNSVVKRTKRVYDAHELFCEMKEIVTRPAIYKFWKTIERKIVPAFKYGYTVNEPIAAEFYRMYGVNYAVIRNLPVLSEIKEKPSEEKYLLYQGAVNEGRSFETLIPAIKNIPLRLLICGDGNFMEQTKKLVKQYEIEDRVLFMGKLAPQKLREVTEKAWLGFTLFDDKGLSNYYSLANRFFDYMHAGVPQICVGYPVYKELNAVYQFAFLISDTNVETIANAIRDIFSNAEHYEQLRTACLQARLIFNWQEEEKRLIGFYQQLFNNT